MTRILLALLALVAEYETARRRPVLVIPAWSSADTDVRAYEDLEWAHAIRRMADRRRAGMPRVVCV